MRPSELSEATWQKSSRSNPAGGACVEVAQVTEGAAVRDSKDPAGGFLAFDHGAFGAFLTSIKSGRFRS